MNPDSVLKLTNTVYKLVDSLPDGDPLKYKCKEKVLAILENVTLLHDNQARSDAWVLLQQALVNQAPIKIKRLNQLQSDCLILEKYLQVGKHQGWISPLNFIIVAKEYQQLQSQIAIAKDRLSILSANVEFEDAKVENNESEFQPTPSGEISEEKQNKSLPSTLSQKREGISSKALVRQEKILKILHEKQKAQVSDLIKEIPNITKRTVRRDLDDLLKRGKVVRVGEWNQVFYQISKV